MKKRKFADGGAAEAMAQMRLDKALASGKKMPALQPGQEPPSMSPAQAQAMMSPIAAPMSPAQAQSMIGPAPNNGMPNRRFPPRAPTPAETAQLTRAASSSAPQMDYVPGPGGTKIPISGGNRGVTPLPTPGLIGMPQPTPEAIAAGKAIDARKRAMNPPGSYTPPAGINMPGMRTPAPSRTPQQMMKKGGQAKAYASGGSVKGAGIAQRGVRKCKVV